MWSSEHSRSISSAACPVELTCPRKLIGASMNNTTSALALTPDRSRNNSRKRRTADAEEEGHTAGCWMNRIHFRSHIADESSQGPRESVLSGVEDKRIMARILAVICVVELLIVLWIKRTRDRDEMERHSISPQDLHALLASNQDVPLFDVRLPLDLLADSEIIPGARRLLLTKCARIHHSFRKKESRSFIARVLVNKPVALSCVRPSPWALFGSNS
jgi:hypothetical protein